MKRAVTAICVIAMLFCLTSVCASSAGTSSDPLITRSYIDGTYAPALVSAGKEDASSALHAVYNGAVADIPAASGTPSSSSDTLASFYSSSVTLSAGSSFVLTGGSATVSLSRGTLLNVTRGTTVSSGSPLTAGERYVSCENTSATVWLSAGSTCAADGVYTCGDGVYSTSYTAKETPAPQQTVLTRQTILFNGKAVEMEVYNVDGDNYFKLRDMAYLLRSTPYAFSVDFNTGLLAVFAVKGGTYEPNGDEMLSGVNFASTCVVSRWSLITDGAYSACSVYNIGGNNFFRLRDLGAVFGFGVDYDDATNSAVITA